MTDVFSTEKRSWIMSRVRSQDTAPEMKVRSITHRLGYRYRLHRKDLPGNPDLVFPSRKKVIFVHGCFWHGHDCSRGGRIPKANTKYWQGKINKNIERDKKNQEALQSLGWETLIIWECDLKDPDKVILCITKYLSMDG
ncbi:MAG: DNA mismatch endonuclease Vsr [Deltaproteobacteria bacterium]|jgi:DNA mismatch endonuclease (patch repair protein)|nr:DNA mismatch endonuclease Vsr [Deltaproteobacteria bacterium]MDX9762539.1 DNA mismatch endonuclease Vsr [Desulfomonilia bacterium]